MPRADARSDGDECDDAVMTAETALGCPISTKTICGIMKQCICIETRDPMNMHLMAIEDMDAMLIERVWHVDALVLIQNALELTQDKKVLRIIDNDIVEIITDSRAPKPVFIFAMCMVLLAHVMGRDLSVLVSPHQMGIPGTSLTLRPGCV